MEKYTIVLNEKPTFWLGDRFYKVEAKYGRYGNDKVILAAKCPSCNDEKKITYQGHDGKTYEAECPVCNGNYLRSRYREGNAIELINWVVNEYFVYEISAHGPEQASKYKDGIGYMDSLSLRAFCRYGRCGNEFLEKDVPRNKNFIDRSIEGLAVSDESFAPDDYVFSKKSEATKLLKAVKNRDVRRLIEFNKKFGTEYEYPF